MRKRGSYGPETRFSPNWPHFHFGKRSSMARNTFHGRTKCVSAFRTRFRTETDLYTTFPATFLLMFFNSSTEREREIVHIH